MNNIATVLKAEISRLARKEVRAEIEHLRKASLQQRGAIAQLRRQVAELEKELKQASRQAQSTSSTNASPSNDKARRFSASRLAAHRGKLGISAAAYGRLIGMSGATIYLWEQGKSRPSAGQLQRLAQVRSLSKSEAHERASA